MPPTRMQKAKERQSRLSDVMCDLKNMDTKLGYSRNEWGSNQVIDEMNLYLASG